MGQRQLHEVILTTEEREYLIASCKKSDWTVRQLRRAQILLRADKNGLQPKQDWEIAEELHCDRQTITHLRRRFINERLEVINDKPRSGRPRILDGDIEAHVVAIACSEPPAGRERWTLRLIADKIITLTDLDYCSHVSIGEVLKKTNLSLGKKGSGKSLRRPMKSLCGEWKKS